ncbi:NUDIX hydrolase [Clostridium beijerinckii]|uniref:ADP-ribose pyrophosphatase YjhB (NUDIX family) n=1 Tax=Clostridium beijerinckii TaxID=1520 RepID=A0A9Q5CYC1_CLOBE|nr:NUDIX domain-containing protein [Clostridium beijerinckii]AQS04812.1 bifunctional nicotinamide mononucleotide adenylyltransferase/ADP-ribose pyrophosphatase [Clostridium beijerinckii]MBA2887511.1 ADP-ribose pyrophosphatase YjhB (NUDIX family) [Clostridium beijerinckii]MBA2902401.1 ADP-ribose pyrophosphatase YjhB (NUDIX family) [Clostridium beijerinckii]MBA2912309.1 ADP-ribose pyrophosphatase YjhB (NUDIX family) [Clostridium beijerinckii]MBC2418456.1 NUDIX hydrolase [Clostridium beijerinckii
MNKELADKNEREFLSEYDVNIYDRPSVTNDIIIFTTGDRIEENSRKVPKKGMQILLIKRDDYPYKGKWAIPGGFVKNDESLEEGALRKLKEETGIDNVYTEQLYTFGEINRDPRTRVISIGNIALISKEDIRFGDYKDRKESKWFWVEKNLVDSKKDETHTINKYILKFESEDEEIKFNYEIIEKIERTIFRKKENSYKTLNESNDELAFDHYKIIDYAVDRIRNKIEYTPIALNLLPRLFTVKELQNVYEAIMGREILNFRRKMEDMIIETDEKIEGKPFRPAKVFKFNENWEHNF